MIRVNAEGRKCSTALTGTGKCSSDTDGWPIKTSVLRVFERAVTCANLGDARGRRDVQLAPGEHSIDFMLQATWPVFPGSKWQTYERDPTKDQISATFHREGSGGAIAEGTMQFVSATPTSGAISMRLASTNPSLDSSGSVSGTVPFAVCP